MGAWILVGLTLAAFAYSMYKQSKLAAPAQATQRFDTPTSEEGVAIPVVFGSAIIRNVNVAGIYERAVFANSVGTLDGDGNLIVNESIDKGAPLYRATMHLGLCHGKIDSVLDVYADEKSCLVSRTVGVDGLTRLTLASGKDVTRSNNWGGTARISEGTANLVAVDTGVADYLARVQGMPGNIGSHYRGVATAMLPNFMWGTSPILRPLAFAVKRIHTRHGGTQAQWYDAKAEISAGVHGREDLWKWKLVAKADTSDYSGIGVDDSAWGIGPGGFGNATRGHVISKDFENYTTVPSVGTQFAGDQGGGVFVGGYPEYSVPEGVKLWLRWDMGPLPKFPIVVQCWHDDSAKLWCNGYAVELVPANLDLVKEHFTSTALIPIEYLNEAGPNVIAYRVQDSYAADGVTRIGTNKLIYAGIQVGADVGSEPPPGVGSMNPAHIILEALTDKIWGMGYNDADVDLDSFAAAADVLYAEDLGLSFEWSQQMSIEDLIDDVKRHIAAVLYVAPSTGLFTLKLLREDYVIADLPVLDEAHVATVEEASRRQPAELINSVTVTYSSSLRGDKGSTAPLFDDSLVAIQGGIVSTQIDYPAITSPVNAAKLAMRDLRILSARLLTCRIVADRTAADFHPGKPFVLNWPDLGIVNFVMRVDEIDSGNGIDNAVKITCVEDVFFLPSQVSVAPNDPVGLSPVSSPTPAVAVDEFRTALTTDKRNRGTVETAFNASAFGEGDVFGGWTEVEPGVMVCDTQGLVLTPAMFDGVNPFTGVPGGAGYGTGEQWIVGRTCFALAGAGAVVGKQSQGPWIVDDIGSHWLDYGLPTQAFVATYARMHRAPGFNQSADFAGGMVVRIRNGAVYGGHYLQLDTDGVVLGITEQEWSDEGTTFAFADTYDLLRRDQFVGRAVSPDSLLLITQTAITADFPHAFPTLPGTPGAVEIPAGPWSITAQDCILSGGDLGAITTLGFKVFRSGATPGVLFEIQTAALADGFNVLGEPLVYQAPALPMAPTDTLVLIPTLHTTSSTPVTIALACNAGGAIVVQMPRAITSKATVDDGWFDVTIVDGVIADFAEHRRLRVHGAGPLVGIAAAGLKGGVPLTLSFVEGITITADGAPSSGAPIKTKRLGVEYQDMDVAADDIVTLALMTDSGDQTFWQFAGGSA